MPTVQTLLLILTILISASMGWSSHIEGTHAAQIDPSIVDGRLGGDRDSFDAAYADRQPEVTGSGTLFSFDDLGLFLVNFQARTREPAPSDIAAVIVISSPRDPATPADASDAMDWTTSEALETARRFLPTDAVVEPVSRGTAPADGASPSRSEQPSCRSEALAETDFGPGSREGRIDCQIAMIQPTPDTVSFLTLSLTSSQLPVVSQDPCAEMETWATATGDHMSDAETLIASIDELDLTATDAPTRLDEIADGLRALADDQRELVAPPPAARAQQALLGALDDYVAALELAADAIAAADNTQLDEAVELATTARDQYLVADDRVLLALRACSLAPGET